MTNGIRGQGPRRRDEDETHTLLKQKAFTKADEDALRAELQQQGSKNHGNAGDSGTSTSADEN